MRTSPASYVAEAAGSPSGSTEATGVSLSTRVADLKELLKPGISGFVVVSAAAGYLLGVTGGIAWEALIGLLLGTALTAGGAGALNHAIERRYDALMHRTQDRPLPAGRMRTPFVFAYGMVFVLAGLAALALTVNTLTTVLALATVLLYVAVYTPLKRRTVHNTLIGAIPGALPALGGYTAAHGEIGALGLVVFGILFLWQLPHFYALAWMLRDDYARGGFIMLPSVDPSGVTTGRMALAATLMLVIVGALPMALGAAGWLYFVGMLALGTAFTLPAFSFHAEPSDLRARRLLIASIIYIPVFFALVLVDFLLRS